MRTVLDESLPDVCVIQTQGWASDGMGGGSATYSAAGTVECRISPGGLTPTERSTGDVLTVIGDYTATVPAGTAVPSSGRITSGGRTFEILDAKRRSWEISLRIAMREVR